MSLTVEEYEKRRAARLGSQQDKKSAQLEKDLEVLDRLEDEHGVSKVHRFDLNRYVDGLPTFVVVRAPRPVEHQRFVEQVGRSKGDMTKLLEASGAFASVAMLYPEPELRDKLKEEFPQILSEIAEVAQELCKAKASAEGKG